MWGANTIVLHPKAKHTHTLIWLHGIGDSGKDFKGMFMEESLVNLPEGCKVILPTAPKRKQSAHGGSDLTSWFNIKSMSWPSDRDYLTNQDLDDKYD
jgi:predicted esterase